jgi:hypothetical protein
LKRRVGLVGCVFKLARERRELLLSRNEIPDLLFGELDLLDLRLILAILLTLGDG